MTGALPYRLGCLTNLLHWVCVPTLCFLTPLYSPSTTHISLLGFRWSDWELPLFIPGNLSCPQGGNSYFSIGLLTCGHVRVPKQ
ncbi:hypothetical protein XENOCAPTIV_028929 [Xenoophorus captivus]|uniref:Secreted protein n=1 Tax=Xenoophorus captivus TaxID=1517983 RepID=A0ABV0QCB9_9TELE